MARPSSASPSWRMCGNEVSQENVVQASEGDSAIVLTPSSLVGGSAFYFSDVSKSHVSSGQGHVKWRGSRPEVDTESSFTRCDDDKENFQSSGRRLSHVSLVGTPVRKTLTPKQINVKSPVGSSPVRRFGSEFNVLVHQKRQILSSGNSDSNVTRSPPVSKTSVTEDCSSSKWKISSLLSDGQTTDTLLSPELSKQSSFPALRREVTTSTPVWQARATESHDVTRNEDSGLGLSGPLDLSVPWRKRAGSSSTTPLKGTRAKRHLESEWSASGLETPRRAIASPGKAGEPTHTSRSKRRMLLTSTPKVGPPTSDVDDSIHLLPLNRLLELQGKGCLAKTDVGGDEDRGNDSPARAAVDAGWMGQGEGHLAAALAPVSRVALEEMHRHESAHRISPTGYMSASPHMIDPLRVGDDQEKGVRVEGHSRSFSQGFSAGSHLNSQTFSGAYLVATENTTPTVLPSPSLSRNWPDCTTGTSFTTLQLATGFRAGDVKEGPATGAYAYPVLPSSGLNKHMQYSHSGFPDAPRAAEVLFPSHDTLRPANHVTATDGTQKKSASFSSKLSASASISGSPFSVENLLKADTKSARGPACTPGTYIMHFNSPTHNFDRYSDRAFPAASLLPGGMPSPIPMTEVQHTWPAHTPSRSMLTPLVASDPAFVAPAFQNFQHQFPQAGPPAPGPVSCMVSPSLLPARPGHVQFPAEQAARLTQSSRLPPSTVLTSVENQMQQTPPSVAAPVDPEDVVMPTTRPASAAVSLESEDQEENGEDSDTEARDKKTHDKTFTQNSNFLKPAAALDHLRHIVSVYTPNVSLSPSLVDTINSVENDDLIVVINSGLGIVNPKYKSSAIPPSDVPGSFWCSVCNKDMKCKRMYNRHRRNHWPVRHFLCVFCMKGFNDSFDLKRHTRTHTGNKPYACPIQPCTKTCAQRVTLENHLEKIHGVKAPYEKKERRPKVYVCELCQTTYHTRHQVVEHTKASHPNDPCLQRLHDRRHFGADEGSAENQPKARRRTGRPKK